MAAKTFGTLFRSKDQQEGLLRGKEGEVGGGVEQRDKLFWRTWLVGSYIVEMKNCTLLVIGDGMLPSIGYTLIYMG